MLPRGLGDKKERNFQIFCSNIQLRFTLLQFIKLLYCKSIGRISIFDNVAKNFFKEIKEEFYDLLLTWKIVNKYWHYSVNTRKAWVEWSDEYNYLFTNLYSSSKSLGIKIPHLKPQYEVSPAGGLIIIESCCPAPDLLLTTNTLYRHRPGLSSARQQSVIC